jgi:hypothetical protein
MVAMTVRIEIFWPRENILAAAKRLFEHRPNVVGREPLVSIEDAEEFLKHRLRRQLEGEPLERVSHDCINLYTGHWVHLLVTQNPQIVGNRLESEIGQGDRFSVTGVLDQHRGLNSLTLERPSDSTCSLAVHATFLVDLSR